MRSKTARGLTQEGGEDVVIGRVDEEKTFKTGRTVSDTFKMSRRDGALES